MIVEMLIREIAEEMEEDPDVIRERLLKKIREEESSSSVDEVRRRI